MRQYCLAAHAMKILCLTVFPDEFLALQRAIHHPWQETLTPCGTPYLATDYNGLQLALVHLSAKSLANPQRLISLGDHLKPQLIVMVGICRGNPAKVVLGDIIVAQKIFTLPTANRTSDSAYILAQPWQTRLLGQSSAWQQQIQTPRPKSSLHQRGWLLHTLYDHELKPDHCPPPQAHPERRHHCPDWPLIFEQLVTEKLLTADPVRLTALAIDLIRDNHALHLATGFPHDPAVPTVHLGAIADVTNTNFQTEEDPFATQTHLFGLDIGSAATTTLATAIDCPAIVIKAVQSYGNPQPPLPFRAYATEAAAQFFLGFLRHLTPQIPLSYSRSP